MADNALHYLRELSLSPIQPASVSTLPHSAPVSLASLLILRHTNMLPTCTCCSLTWNHLLMGISMSCFPGSLKSLLKCVLNREAFPNHPVGAGHSIFPCPDHSHHQHYHHYPPTHTYTSPPHTHTHTLFVICLP